MSFRQKPRSNYRQRFTQALAMAALILQSSFLLPACAQPVAPPPPSPEPMPMKPQTPKLAPTAAPVAPANGSATPKAAPSSTTGIKGKPATGATSPAAAQKPAKTSTMPPTAPPVESYNQVAELERLMFGEPKPNIPVEYRLDRLESEVFHHTNPEWDVKKRIDRLHETLVGSAHPGIPAAAPPPDDGYYQNAAPGTLYPPTNGYGAPGYGTVPYGQNGAQMPPYGVPTGMPQYGAPYQQNYAGDVQAAPASTPSAYVLPPPGDLNSPDFQQELPLAQLHQAALQMINDARVQQGLTPLVWDDLAAKVAEHLVLDNCKRNTVSHQDQNGDNPDVRYTKNGGTDCMVESITSLKMTSRPVLNKALIYNVIKEMTSHQDDRDALFSVHATHGAFCMGWNSNRDKLIACTEVVTKQADVASLSAEARVGDKLEVKGVITGPYKFARITVAWEGLMPTSGDDAEQQEEALPYFPPLDYEAFSKRAEHDWQRGKQLLQIGGIALALAGGVFIPPVALAAPLIAAGGAASMKPKAVSDIPVRGGVHVDGASFSHKLPLSKDSKEGIYYVTIWANSDADPTPFAVSRRAIIARTGANNTTSNAEGTPPGNVKISDNNGPANTDEAATDSANGSQPPKKQDDTPVAPPVQSN